MLDDVDAALRAVLALTSDGRRQFFRRLLACLPDKELAACRNAQFRALGLKVAAYDALDPGPESLCRGAERFAVKLGDLQDAFGCPWCRRPLALTSSCRDFEEGSRLNGGTSPSTPRRALPPSAVPSTTSLPPSMSASPSSVGQAEQEGRAVCTLLYGASPQYFFGACVLGSALLQHDAGVARVLVHTVDVPEVWLQFLAQRCGWTLRKVDYLKGNDQVARCLFHGSIWRCRFKDVFTKLQALTLPYSKVLLLDLDILVREPIADALLSLQVPAALVRGEPVPKHGEKVPYERFWDNYGRRKFDGEIESLPRHQQSTGINAGVMLLPGQRPDAAEAMMTELADWAHPEHYATYMPEQEYLGRWFGTFMGPQAWTHISCRYNFELDKDARVPFDFTEEHRKFKADVAWGLQNLSIAHFSGTRIKPWDLLFVTGTAPSDEVSMLLAVRESSSDAVKEVLQRCGYRGAPPVGAQEDQLLSQYSDALTRACMREWLAHFRETFRGVDTPTLLLKGIRAAEEAERRAAAACGESSSWYSNGGMHVDATGS
eukprot:TRINITY_DN68340_c0_g1_i1.p1 TRINITY_DN68340_c0_g1~~TRINITY_DN68340_c0_g1_i1.p1  ORF type:complete len:545 (-),score=78.86 TRINITY_DN68340_c0_g1_i1:2-1636(-)